MREGKIGIYIYVTRLRPSFDRLCEEHLCCTAIVDAFPDAEIRYRIEPLRDEALI